MPSALSASSITPAPAHQRVMRLEQVRQPLQLREVPLPECEAHELLLRVMACGVCRTDLHIVDGDLPAHRLPIVPGHEVVGIVEQVGAGTRSFVPGDKVGVPWLASACGHCEFCCHGRENLCDAARFTGYDRDGGYAEFMTATADACLRLPPTLTTRYDDAQLAPLLCAGLIGYRAYALSGAVDAQAPLPVQRLGLYGFGAAAHILTQLACWQGKEVFAFTRPGDGRAQAFARRLGAVWAGASTEPSPLPLDAALLFAPAGELVPQALAAVRKGGVVVCAGIHMSAIPAFPYALLWGERTVCSVANLTHQDGDRFLALAAQCPLHLHAVTYPLERANDALRALREGEIEGAAVLMPGIAP